jgi:Leucine-rich repeat (LRR) protein
MFQHSLNTLYVPCIHMEIKQYHNKNWYIRKICHLKKNVFKKYTKKLKMTLVHLKIKDIILNNEGKIVNMELFSKCNISLSSSHLYDYSITTGIFDLSNSSVVDISELTKLPLYVNVVRLNRNKIVDISSLSSLPSNLLILCLFSNQIVDITPLTNLPVGLQTINLCYNEIENIDALSNLPCNLKYLYLHHNKITDITPLANLPDTLRSLYIDNNLIVDIDPLSNVPSTLLNLDIDENYIVDYNPIIKQIAYKWDMKVSTSNLIVKKHLKNPNRKIIACILTLASVFEHYHIGWMSPFRNIHSPRSLLSNLTVLLYIDWKTKL